MSAWSSWHETDAEQHGPWRAAFNREPVGPAPAGPCPVCGVPSLHRWYVLDDDDARVLRGARYLGHGRLWEWCATCRTYEHYRDGFVPEWWKAPFAVDPELLRYDPGPVEEARQASIAES